MIDFDATVLRACVASFGEKVTYLPALGPPLPMTAIFTEKGKIEKESQGEPIIEEATTLGCQQSQFGDIAPQANEVFLIRGIYWRIAEVLADGHGHLQLHVMLTSDAQADVKPLPPVS